MLVISTLFIWSFSLQAQDRLSRDSTWIKWNNDIVSKLDLTNLSIHNKDYHWRFGYYGQVVSYFVDLTIKGNGLSEGKVTIYTNEYVDATKEVPTKRVYNEKTILRLSQVDSLYTALQELKINDIPIQESVKGWEMGFDGVTYSVELQSNNKYSFKTYWTPEGQDNVPEAKRMVEFIKRLEQITSIPQLEKVFTSNIPFQSYNTGGPATAIRVLTKKQSKQYRKDRDAYRKKMHLTNTP